MISWDENDKTMVIILGTLWHQLRQTGPDPNLTRHLSQDLRQVIQLMMLNDGNLQKYLQFYIYYFLLIFVLKNPFHLENF